jgi:hypothetical protein
MSALRKHHTSLLDRRAELEQEITALERVILSLGGSPGSRAAGAPAAARGSVRRGKTRAGSLKDYITRVMSNGQTMAVKDITDAVMRAGFQSKNKTLSKSVGIALTEIPGMQKVGRGQFRMSA